MPSSEKLYGYRTLGDWQREGNPLFAKCGNCGRQVCLLPAVYAARFGAETRFWRTMKRLRCTVCRSPAVIRKMPSGPIAPNLMEVFDGP